MFKRLAIVTVTISLLCSNVAYAGFGVHKSIDPDSDSCTGCHRQHIPLTQQGLGVGSGLSTSLIETSQTSEYEFCITCHGPDATGADTDIVFGVYKNADNTYGTFNEELNGGGFTKVGGMEGNDVTSTHAIDGGMYTAFGDASGSSFAMTCSSCHDPAGSSNYRLLKDTLNGQDVSNFVQSNEEGFQTESISMPKSPKQFDTYIPNYTDALYRKSSDTTRGISGWCAGCHSQYASAGNTYTDSEGKDRFHHAINVRIGDNPSRISTTRLPLEKVSAGTSDSDPGNFVGCLTCHFAHGSSVTMSDNARVEPTRSTPASGPGYSSLLRMDNRGVCQDCHNK